MDTECEGERMKRRLCVFVRRETEVIRCCESGKLASFRVGLQELRRQTTFRAERRVQIKQHDSSEAAAPLWAGRY